MKRLHSKPWCEVAAACLLFHDLKFAHIVLSYTKNQNTSHKQSKLVGEMWMTAKQLEFRKEDLELKISFLEEEKRRKEEEAAEAAAAAAEALVV